MGKKVTSTIIAALLALSTSATALADPGTVVRSVNFRSSPSTSSTVYGTLKAGTNIEVLEKVNAYWLKVKASGKVGYVSPSYVEYSAAPQPAPQPKPQPAPQPADSKADQIIAHAKDLQGITTYHYGVNKPPSQMDCSAFTKYVFGLEGVSLKWGTRYQKDAGSEVAKQNLKKGDLVFFWISNSNEIGHVGIYIGDGQFIHNNPSFNGVGISSLSTGYWANHYVTARRVLP